MTKLTDRAYMAGVLKKYGFSFSKALGQNFLINPAIAPKICQHSGIDSTSCVLEIGCGIGVLTRELAKAAKSVLCVEIDRRLIPVLEETLADCDNVFVINDDILKIDIASTLRQHFGEQKVSVCANLPYYITTPIIMHLLEGSFNIDSITVMVQKEAAQRICAEPGTRACGAISAAVRYYCEPQILFNVARGSFVPAPNVDSSVIRLGVKADVQNQYKSEFFKVVRAAFSMRRKNLVNCFSVGLDMSKARAEEFLNSAGIDINTRGEQLTMEQLYLLAQKFSEFK